MDKQFAPYFLGIPTTDINIMVSVHQRSGRLGFDPWSSHTKDSKNGS